MKPAGGDLLPAARRGGTFGPRLALRSRRRQAPCSPIDLATVVPGCPGLKASPINDAQCPTKAASTSQEAVSSPPDDAIRVCAKLSRVGGKSPTVSRVTEKMSPGDLTPRRNGRNVPVR